MMASEGRISKKKLGSKKKKSAWRKKTDIIDVEAFLEGERLEERTGGRASDKKDDQLFFIEKDASAPKVLPSRRKKTPKPMRALGGSLPNELKPQERPPKKMSEKMKKKILKKYEAKAAATKEAEVVHDPWENGENDEIGEINEAILLSRKALGITKIRVPKHRYKPPSSLPAVAVADAGASYNPTFEDHQALMQEVETEKEKIRQEKANRKKRQEKLAQLPVLEIRDTLFDSEEETEEESEDEEDAEKPDIKKPKPKTKKQIKKKKLAKAEEAKRLKLKKEKQFNNDCLSVKSISKKVRKEMMEHEEKLKKLEALREANKDRPKKFSGVRYKEPLKDVKELEEIEGSYRLLEPSGCLLKDRMQSLQRRNMVVAKGKGKRSRRTRIKPKFYLTKGE